MHLCCFSLVEIVAIYALWVCKIFGPNIRSCKFFDRSRVWSGSFQDYSSQSCHFCFLSLEVGHFFIPFPFCYEPLFVYLWIFWGKHLLLRGQFQHLPPELSSQWLFLVGWLCISWSYPVCSLSTPQYDLAPPWNPPKIDTQTTQSSPVSSSPPFPPSPAPMTHSSTLLCNISLLSGWWNRWLI